MLRLPEDIQVDICLRLPAHDVLTCRWVCSPLRNLLSSPKFIKDHLERSIERSNPSLMIRAHSRWSNIKKPLIYTTDYATLSDARPLSDFDEWERKGCPVEFEKYSVVEIVGSCNGLIAYSIGEPGMQSNIFIWNPVTREYKTVPIPFLDNSHPFCRYGFGYDRSIDDYKFVGLSWCQARIYTLGSESWTTIDTIPYEFCRTIDPDPGVFINGALHWLGSRITDGMTSSAVIASLYTFSDIIASLDISSERFVDVEAPKETLPDHLDRYSELDISVGVFRDCLSFVARDFSCFTVWVMQNYGVKESWSIQITITWETIPDYLWDTWDTWGSTKPIWCLNNGEVLMVNLGHGVLLYDSRNTKLHMLSNVVPKSLSTERWMYEPVCYVETLVSLNSGTYVENRTKWLLED